MLYRTICNSSISGRRVRAHVGGIIAIVVGRTVFTLSYLAVFAVVVMVWLGIFLASVI